MVKGCDILIGLVGKLNYLKSMFMLPSIRNSLEALKCADKT